MWRIGVPNWAIFFALLKNNVLVLLGAPAGYFVSPLVQGQTVLGTAFIILITGAALTGIFCYARENGFRPFHFVLPFYACLVLLWNYPQANRFLVPFLPLFAAGLWLEGKRLSKLVRVAISSEKPLPQRFIAVAFTVLIVVFVFIVVANYVGSARTLPTEVSSERAVLLPEKRQAYEWLSRFTDSSARIVAYEDAKSISLYGSPGNPAF